MLAVVVVIVSNGGVGIRSMKWNDLKDIIPHHNSSATQRHNVCISNRPNKQTNIQTNTFLPTYGHTNGHNYFKQQLVVVVQ